MTARRLNTALAVLCVALFAGSLSVGASPVGLLSALAELAAGTGSTAAIIFTEIRVPRAVLGFAVGASLGLAGAALQGWLRNPLAEPGVVGVSPFAALGAVIAFYSGWSTALPLVLPLGGIAGALSGVAILYGLAGRSTDVVTMVLAGTALSSLASALTSLALSLSPNPFALTEIVFWLLGSLADRSLSHVALTLPFMGLGWVMLLSIGTPLDALTLGEATARSLGVDLARLRFRLVLGTALAVGAAVAVTGAIGFVGLIVPHLLRPLVGWQPGRLLLPSALGGAVLTMAADIAVRMPVSGSELKLGVVTALIGAPFFLALVLKMRATAP